MTLGGSGGIERNPNKRLQRTGISVPLIDNLSHDVVVSRPLKRSVRRLPVFNIVRNRREHEISKVVITVFSHSANI